MRAAGTQRSCGPRREAEYHAGPAWWCLLPALLACSIGCGQKANLQPAGLFPEGNEVQGWVKTGETRTFEASHLWEYIDGDAERYLRAGVKRTLTADYRYEEKIEATADIYIMGAAEGARKVFESESLVGSQPLQLGDAARLSKGSLTFRSGPYFVRIVAYQEAPEAGDALVTLGKGLDRNLSESLRGR